MKILRRARKKKTVGMPNAGLIPHDRISTSPGEILKETVLRPRKVSILRASRMAHIPLTELKAILGSHVCLTRLHAKRVAALTGTSQAFWLNLERTFRRSATTQEFLKALRVSQRQMQRGDRGRPMQEVWASVRHRIASFNRRGGKGTVERYGTSLRATAQAIFSNLFEMLLRTNRRGFPSAILRR